MREFLTVAMPWILIGLCLVLGICLHLRKKHLRHPEEQKGQESRINEGACIGMCIGVAVSAVGGCNPGTFLCVGGLAGAVIGSLIRKP